MPPGDIEFIGPDGVVYANADAAKAALSTKEATNNATANRLRTQLIIEGIESNGVASVDPAHLEALVNQGTKVTPGNVLATGSMADGSIVFLESGNAKTGLQHIVERRASEFADIGVPESQIPNVIMQTVTKGTPMGFQGATDGRQIFAIAINGVQRQIAISVSKNGYIVGANPK